VGDEDSSIHSDTSVFGSAKPGDSNDLVSTETQLSLMFPLSKDHLITIVQYNIIRASTTNAIILSIFDQFPRVKCGLDLTNLPLFPTNMQWTSPGLPASGHSADIPDGLRPTALQVSTPHELWIDLIPGPTFRDNVLAAIRDNVFEPIEFQADITGQVCQDKLREYRRTSTRLCRESRRRGLSEPGILVWSDPWCTHGYEITEAFLEKWAFLLRGCWDLIAATNRWRALRGEDPLVVDLL
jgi:hypothetical protein